MPTEAIDAVFLATYPFVHAARDYVAGLGLSLAELFSHPIYGGCLAEGKKRLAATLNGRLEPEIPADPVSQEISVLSFAVARLLAHATESRPIIESFGAAEARRARMLFDAADEAQRQALKTDLDVKVTDGTLPLKRYLELIPRLVREDSRHKLVNKPVTAGKVQLAAGDETLLMREAVYHRIIEPVPTRGLPKELAAEAKKIAKARRERRHAQAVGALDPDCLPPCIDHVIGLLEVGEASHNTMFILGTFLLNLGLPEDQILDVFRAMPTFDEDKARYQLSVLAGGRGGTEYTCPGCASIKSYGLCVADCQGIKHPLQLYRQRAREKRFRGRPPNKPSSAGEKKAT